MEGPIRKALARGLPVIAAAMEITCLSEAVTVTRLGYDGLGNLAQVTTPPNHAGQVQTFSIGYDSETRTYPTTTIDGFGYTSRPLPRFVDRHWLIKTRGFSFR